MYNCSISKHSKLLRREVRKIADIKGKELGLTRGSVAWDNMVTQIKRELLKKTTEIEQKYSYVAPRLRQVYCKKDRHTKLYNLKYILEKEKEKDEVLSILSDTTNLTPYVIELCVSHRNSLINNATEAEIKVQEKISALNIINYVFQKPFFICENIYFADFYLPEYNTIIEVDGGYHNAPSQMQRDNERAAYLKSVGIQVVRITNKDSTDSLCVYGKIYNILYGSPQNKTLTTKRLKRNHK